MITKPIQQLFSARPHYRDKTILTLLPLAFSIGKGSEMQQPLAIAIISRLVVQLPLVLLLMPVLLHLMRDRERPTSPN